MLVAVAEAFVSVSISNVRDGRQIFAFSRAGQAAASKAAGRALSLEKYSMGEDATKGP